MKTKKILFLFFFVLAVCFNQISAQIITETKTITDLKPLLPNAENKKPLLVNFWATWCGPCRVEFPELVKIDADYRAKGLNFVIVSVDNFSLIDTRVPEFLESYESTMPSYFINLPGRRAIARAIRQIAPRFPDAYPLTLLFDKNGKLVYQKNGVINPKILRTRIDKVLPKEETK